MLLHLLTMHTLLHLILLTDQSVACGCGCDCCCGCGCGGFGGGCGGFGFGGLGLGGFGLGAGLCPPGLLTGGLGGAAGLGLGLGGLGLGLGGLGFGQNIPGINVPTIAGRRKRSDLLMDNINDGGQQLRNSNGIASSLKNTEAQSAIPHCVC